MKSANWIKVEDRLPEAKYRTNIEKGYSDVVLICGFRYTPNGAKLRFADAAYYDHEYRDWYDQNDDKIAGGVTHWQPIELPEDDCKGMDSKLSSLVKPCPNFTPKEE